MIISRKDFKTMCKTMDEIVKKNNDILSFLKTSSNMHKEALNLCPKWIVKLIVGYGVD